MQQNSKIKRSEQEKGMVMGVLTREMESQAIIHSSFLHFWRWPQVWSSFLMHLGSTTNLPWYLSHQSLAYIHTSSLLVSLYDTNTVSVIKVLETSGLSFVYNPVITLTMSWQSLHSSAHCQSSQDAYLIFTALSYIFYCSLNANHQYQSNNCLS